MSQTGAGDRGAPAPNTAYQDALVRAAFEKIGYQVDGVLGRGGFGAVYRAERVVDGARVAIKLALPDQIDGAGRLEREAVALETVGAPHVPAVHGRGFLEGRYYVVLECIEAPTLAERLVREGGPMPLENVAAHARAILRALAAIHACGIVHRDLKPENIFIDDAGGAKIIDFGLAKEASSAPQIEEVTTADDAMGTAEYMSPEQCDGLTDADLRADIYSVGVLLYEMMSGAPPFWGMPADVRESQRSRRPAPLGTTTGCPPEIDRVVRRCLAKDRSRRFDSVAELQQALDEAIADVARAAPSLLSSRPPSPPDVKSASTADPVKAAPAREKRTMGLIFFDSAAGIGAVQPILTAAGGQLVQTNGTQYVAAFGHDIGDNPARSALVAAQRLKLAGVSARLLVDIASVSVQMRPDGSRRVFSPIFSKKDRFLPPGPAAVILTSAAAEVISDLHLVPAEGRADRFQLQLRASEDATSYGIQPTGIVGREALVHELLDSAQKALVASRPTLACVSGHAGHGRTHLATAFAQRLVERVPAADVIRLTAQETIVGAVSQILPDLLRRLFDLPLDAPSEEEARALLIGRLGDDVGPQVWAAAAFALGWIGAEHAEVRKLAAAPGALRLASARAAGEAMRRRAERRPLAIILDDAHLADEVTLDSLEYATLKEARSRIWGLVLVRPGFERGRPAWGTRAEHSSKVTLPPLETRDAIELARRLLQPIEHVLPEVLARLAARTQGIPRLLVELVRGLKQEGAVRRSARGTGYYLATDELDKLPDLPVIQWNATREVEALPPQLAGHARLSSVLGASFTIGEVEALLQILERGGNSDELATMQLDASVGIQRLVDAGLLLQHRNGLFDFRHSLLRDTIYQQLSEAQARTLHRAAFELYRSSQMPAERRLPRLALHAARSGAKGEAADAYLALADRATQAHAYLEAEASFGAALANLSDGDDHRLIDASRGRALMRLRLGRHEDALADLRKARDLAHRGERIAHEVELLLDEATVLDWTRDFVQSAALVRTAQSLAKEPSGLVAARLSMALARSHHRRGEADECVKVGAEAVARAEALGGAGYETFVIALLMVAPDCANLGRLDEAERFFERLLGAADSRSDLFHYAAGCINRASLWFAKKDVERVFQDLSRAAQIAHEIAIPVVEYIAVLNMAETAYSTGELDRAADHVVRASALARQLWGETNRELSRCDLLLARIALYREDISSTRRLIDAVRARADTPRSPGSEDVEFFPSDQALFDMIELGSRSASPSEWDAFAERCRTLELQPLEEVEIIEGRALAAARGGRRDESRALLKNALELSVRKPNLLSDRVERRYRSLVESSRETEG